LRKLISKFSEIYFQQNENYLRPRGIISPVAVSMIVQASLLLNSDLHSRQVSNKMTKKEFLVNCRGVPEFETISDEYLLNLYQRVAKNKTKTIGYEKKEKKKIL